MQNFNELIHRFCIFLQKYSFSERQLTCNYYSVFFWKQSFSTNELKGEVEISLDWYKFPQVASTSNICFGL